MFITPFYRQKCLGTTGHEMPDKSHCVSNHTQLERLFNTCCCSILANIKTSHHWRGIHGSSVDSPHKGPIMQNASSWNRPYSYLQLPMLTRQHVPRFTKLHPWTLLDMAMRPKKKIIIIWKICMIAFANARLNLYMVSYSPNMVKSTALCIFVVDESTGNK